MGGVVDREVSLGAACSLIAAQAFKACVACARDRREIPPLREPTASQSEAEEIASARSGRNDSCVRLVKVGGKIR